MSDVTLIKGHIYRAKKPKRVGVFPGFYNDRQIMWLSDTKVQYDSSSVTNGRKYPTIDRAAFEKWVGQDVTKGYPPNEWQEYPS